MDPRIALLESTLEELSKLSEQIHHNERIEDDTKEALLYQIDDLLQEIEFELDGGEDYPSDSSPEFFEEDEELDY